MQTVVDVVIIRDACVGRSVYVRYPDVSFVIYLQVHDVLRII